MTKASTQQYGAKVRAHLEESFPDGCPPQINVMDAEWHSAITNKVPPPKSMSDVDVWNTISDVIHAWLVDRGFESIGSIYRHAERHAAQQAAEAQQAAAKKEAEIAPLLAIVKRAVVETLLEAGLVSMKPKAIAKPHPTKRGPGRGH